MLGVFLVFVLFTPSSDAALLNGNLGEVNFSTNDYENEDVDIRYYNIGKMEDQLQVSILVHLLDFRESY